MLNQYLRATQSQIEIISMNQEEAQRNNDASIKNLETQIWWISNNFLTCLESDYHELP